MSKKKAKESRAERSERKPNWQEVYATVEDIQQYLEERVMLRYNMVTHQTEVHWLTDWGDDLSRPAEWERINDRIENTLWKDLSKQKPVRMRDLQYVIGSDYVPAYHPFRFYLEHLSPWNGDEDHILGLSLSVNVKGDSDEQFLFAEYLKKWLVAMVASWMDDRVINNVMLVLIGEQGSYKTTWFSHLLPPPLREYFYTKTNSGMVSKDDLLTLSQYGLMCWEELDSMQQKELNKLKAAMASSRIWTDGPLCSAVSPPILGGTEVRGYENTLSAETYLAPPASREADFLPPYPPKRKSAVLSPSPVGGGWEGAHV